MKRESNLTFFPENKVQEYKLWNKLERKKKQSCFAFSTDVVKTCISLHHACTMGLKDKN